MERLTKEAEARGLTLSALIEETLRRSLLMEAELSRRLAAIEELLRQCLHAAASSATAASSADASLDSNVWVSILKGKGR